MKCRIHAYTTIAGVAAMFALAATSLAGCRSEEPVATGGTSSDRTSFVPTLSQLSKAVSLDDGDKRVVAAALEDWQEAVAEQTAKSFRGHRAGMTFIAEVAPSLDNEQLADLVAFLGEYRDEHKKDMRRAFRSKRHDGERKEKLAESLGLSEDQQAAMKAIHTETREKMREQHDAFRAGMISEEQKEQSKSAIHDAQREKLAAVLTEEQLTKMDEIRVEHRTKRVSRRIEHLDEGVDARVGWLTAVLGLSADQRSTLQAALDVSAAERKAALEATRDGSVSRREARAELREHHDSTIKALEGILTPEQSERFEIVRRLHPRKARGE